MNIIILLLLTTFSWGCSSVSHYEDPPYHTNFVPVTPNPIVQALPPAKPKREELIVIDPGHGGEDRGTISLEKPKYQEKQLTLTTSRFLQFYLEYLGYQTKLTRNNDTFIAVHDRAQLANEIEPTLFVSVHYNSAPSTDAHGIEIFYHKSDSDPNRAIASKALATAILNKVLQNTQAKSRGVKTGNFAVIRETHMPAVLIEGGFLTNPDEMERIKNPLYLKQIAWGIAQGIDRYIANQKISYISNK